MNNTKETKPTNELQKSFEYIRQLKNKVYPSEILKFVFNLKLNDKVYGWGEKKPYTVVYVDDRYLVIGEKMFGESMHSIIDKGKLILGAVDRWQFGNYVEQDLCLKCYNRVMHVAVIEFEKIQSENEIVS